MGTLTINKLKSDQQVDQEIKEYHMIMYAIYCDTIDKLELEVMHYSEVLAFDCLQFLSGRLEDHRNLKAESHRMIKQLNLTDHIKFVEHGFLPFADIISIWKAVDCGLQIAAHDALSTSLMEPMLFKKEVIVSKIFP